VGRLLTARHGVRGAREQAASFHSRERRRSHLDPSFELHGTHVFTSADNPIDTDVVFPGTLLEPITFALELVRTDPASNGLLFEFGSSSRGIAAAIDGDDLIVGAGSSVADDGVTITAVDALPREDLRHLVVVTAIPGTGLIAAWVDGQLVGRELAVAGNFNGGWSDDGDGAIEDVAGTVISRIPVGQAVALTDAEVTRSVRAYFKQRPRQIT
jgi:hypothetical protein